MAEHVIADVVVGTRDATGAMIDTVYSKVIGVYAIYRTRERVIVHFADATSLASEQRLALASLSVLRGEINGLVDGWRVSRSREARAKAKLFDRRVADALIIALQGDQAQAADLLAAVKRDVLDERTSVARGEYLLVAASVTVFLAALLASLTGRWFQVFHSFQDMTLTLWTAAGMGAVGAFFSVALQIRDRSILTDLQSRDNAIDAALRILVGAISAVVLVCLLNSSLIGLSLNGRNITDLAGSGVRPGAAAALLMVVSFAAGFVERLVGGMLAGAALAATTATNPLAGSGAGRTAAAGEAQGGPANERNPFGRVAAPLATSGAGAARRDDIGADDDDEDGCAALHGIEDDEVTEDVELGAAIGGVAKAA